MTGAAIIATAASEIRSFMDISLLGESRDRIIAGCTSRESGGDSVELPDKVVPSYHLLDRGSYGGMTSALAGAMRSG